MVGENKMLIGDKYKIESDELQYTVYTKYIPKEGSKRAGEDLWRPAAYYKNLSEAIKWLVDREIKGTGLVGLLEVNKKIEELKRTLIKQYNI
jgi:hypothetical protein